ncbi:MAG TPA: fasciclin domain-containing protein, partial [Acidimicrobiales bacterium]|nr:fasciclin domain-containing protein [Acidimicrobiales bacterium]
MKLNKYIGISFIGLAALAASSAPLAAASASALGTRSPAAMSSPSSMTDFGAACAAVPKSGAGSFSGMTSAPVATAASNNPVLSTLVTAVKKAGLVDTLNNAKGLTVFAPDNTAFAKIPSSALDGILANKMELTKLLEYHVVAGRLTPAQLPGLHKTIEGGSLSVAGNGTTFNVDGTSQVVCGNVQTANATVYIIGTVLSLPSMMTPMTDFGAACAAVPKSGAGSFSGMTSAPVATAASNNPVLSTLVTAVK